jgi:ELWxxDGT repeat protein
MKRQLQTMPCLTTGKMYKGLYILLLMICSAAAHSQPTMLSNIPTGSKNFVYVNGSLYFSAADNLYRGTSTSAPALVKTTGETILRVYDITLGSNFFFITQGGSGERLWRSDGTSANTVPVTTATQIIPLIVYQSQLFMRLNSAATGNELWKVDAAFNATILKDINPGSANGFTGFDGSLITHNNLLYFFADAGSGQDLWRSDGTTAGTLISVDMEEPDGAIAPARLSELTSVNDIMFFTRNWDQSDWYEVVAELWTTDGSAAGTSMVKQYLGNNYNYFRDFIAFNGKVYFFRSNEDPAFVYFSVSDGTAAGTQDLKLVTIDGPGRKLIDAESYLLFYGESQSYTSSLEKYDGTTISVVHGWSMYHSTSDEFIDLTYTGGRAFFLDEAGEYYGGGGTLWQADLAAGVTRPVQEIYNTPIHTSRNITAADGSVFFTTTASGQTSLWYYDPSGSPASCEGTGTILQEIWTNVAGTDVRTFDFSTAPNGGTRTLTNFETSQYYANNYASRMRGLICVPQSGLYTFWISSDDQSQLYISDDPTEEDKRLIAWVYGYTPFRNYDKYPTQKSGQIYLEANRKYYIEVRHKEGNGNDFVSVGWQLPDGTMQRPIPGNRLSAITTPPNQPSSITITSPQPNQSFPAGDPIRIAADVTDPEGVDYVMFDAVQGNGSLSLTSFQNPPYEYEWNTHFPPGSYQIRVTAVDNRGARTAKTVPFTIEEPPCEGTGTVLREVWFGFPGTSLSGLPPNRFPDRLVQLTSLATPNYYGNEYVSRIRGYFCAPATGYYLLYISGDDTAELWVSTDDNPANKQRVAYVPAATRVNEWVKYMTQEGGVELVQGQRYYFEVLHKEANGADHVEVGWQLPSGTYERPIPGNRLITVDPPTSYAMFAASDVTSFEEEGKASISPNPVASGNQVFINLPGATDQEVRVDIKSITGVSVQNETLSSNGEGVIIDLKPSMAAGMYLIRVSNNKKRWATKLQIK